MTSSATRVLGLGRAEFTLLLRNRMQLVTATLLPLGVPFLLLPLAGEGTTAALAGGLGTMFVIALIFIVYYNLLSAYVARRQDLVLKRLRTGEASDAVILASAALPALVVAAAMIVVMSLVATPLLGLPLPENPLAVTLGLGLGALTFVPLALATANITRTVESAQITCLPLMAVLLIGSGAAVPLSLMPEWFGQLVSFTPAAPIAALVRAGWLGVDLFGAPVPATETWAFIGAQSGILLVWLALGVWFVRNYFRWEPRG